MTTIWALPTTIIQYAEPEAESVHIPWDATDDFVGMKTAKRPAVLTTAQVYHIARSPKQDLRTKTYYLQATGFVFTDLPEVITGVELKLVSERRGRIIDDTIQLCLADILIGDNQATLEILPLKTYGGVGNFWEVPNLTVEDIINPTFGVVIRFKSHPNWPHRDAASISIVALRIH